MSPAASCARSEDVRRTVRELLGRARGGALEPTVLLRRALVERRLWDRDRDSDSVGRLPRGPEPSPRAESVSHFLRAAAADGRGARLDAMADLDARWHALARLPLRSMHHHLVETGTWTAACALVGESGWVPGTEPARLIDAFGPWLATRIDRLRAIPRTRDLLSDHERDTLKSLILRLARDHSGAALAVALGLRTVVSDLRLLPEREVALFLHLAPPHLTRLFANIEQLPLQDGRIRSLLLPVPCNGEKDPRGLVAGSRGIGRTRSGEPPACMPMQGRPSRRSASPYGLGSDGPSAVISRTGS